MEGGVINPINTPAGCRFGKEEVDPSFHHKKGSGIKFQRPHQRKTQQEPELGSYAKSHQAIKKNGQEPAFGFRK
jgi:hypothetical protein